MFPFMNEGGGLHSAARYERASAASPMAPCWRSPMCLWREQAEAEGLALLKADNKAGYFGVSLNKPGQPKPYLAQVRRGGKTVCLGYFTVDP